MCQNRDGIALSGQRTLVGLGIDHLSPAQYDREAHLLDKVEGNAVGDFEAVGCGRTCPDYCPYISDTV